MALTYFERGSLSYLVLNPAKVAGDDFYPSEGVYVQLLPGTYFDDSVAPDTFFAAQGLPEPTGLLDTIVAPVLRVETYATDALMTLVALNGMLGLGGDTYRETDTDMLTKVGGAIQFRFGGASATAYRWTNWKVGSLTFSWDPASDPGLRVSMTILPFGRRETPAAPAEGVSQHWGRPWPAAAVSYNNTLSEVQSGSLAFNNGMLPDLTTPMTLDDFADHIRYMPNDYINGPLSCALSVVQSRKAQAQLAGTETTAVTTALTPPQVVFKAAGANPDPTLTFTIQTIHPETGRAVEVPGTNLITRTYRNFPGTVSGTPSVTLAASP
jgi:hypothetical protein